MGCLCNHCANRREFAQSQRAARVQREALDRVNARMLDSLNDYCVSADRERIIDEARD